MLEETLLRVKPFIPLDNIRLVASESMRELILSSIDYLKPDHILGEPQGRNTCLAIGLAAAHLVKEDPKAVMVVLSADHLIRPADKLCQLLEDAATIAAVEDKLITIGIVPTRPETGYGYIKVEEEFKTDRESPVLHVSGFTEKPKAVVAQEYYFSRKYLWNSGMFVWSARVLLESLADCQPEMTAQLNEYSKTMGSSGEAEAREALYEKAESISIDYALLEKATNVLAVRADIIWDDVGSWSALERYKARDKDNNVLIGDTFILDTFETTIYNDSKGIISALGVSDLVIVRSNDITLVVHKTKLDQIKDLLAKIEKNENTRHYL
jgi:mannose-1-phosphate guanylyltransferase/mannose-6-phosphate isomerase